MKTANIMLGFGIGLYYAVATDALFWSMEFYSVLTGYMLCLVFKDKMVSWDKYFAVFICSIIWVVFLVKAIIYTNHALAFDWTRFYIGILFVALTIVYVCYCFTVKLRHHV